MKSIMQEASSVAKAIEKAWISAGRPQEFSVKVFEEAKKNFIGFTTQSAKIGLFFNEKSSSPRDHGEHGREKAQAKNQANARNPIHPKKHESLIKKNESPSFAKEEHDEHAGEDRVIWTPDMVEKATEWINGTLVAMSLSGISFACNVEHYTLTVTFADALLANSHDEKQLFKSFSFLMLQALKRTFKRPLRGFKISLTRAS